MSCARFVPQTSAIRTDTNENHRTCRLEYRSLSACGLETGLPICKKKSARGTNLQIAHCRSMAHATIQRRGEVCADFCSKYAHRKHSDRFAQASGFLRPEQNPTLRTNRTRSPVDPTIITPPSTLKTSLSTSHTQHKNTWFMCQADKESPRSHDVCFVFM